MGADLVEGNVALSKQLDEEGARDVENICRLLRCQLSMDGDDGHRVTLADLGQHIQQQAQSRHRYRHGAHRTLVTVEVDLLGV